MPGSPSSVFFDTRGHYTFNLRDPAKMVQGMLMVDVKSSLQKQKASSTSNHLGTRFATRNKCIASRNKCLTSRNKVRSQEQRASQGAVLLVPSSFLLLVAMHLRPKSSF